MNQLRRVLLALGKIAKMAVALVAIIVIFWAIAYRLFLGFTPLWLDMATLGATAAALLVLWVLGQGKPFDYSDPIDKPRNRT